ncbi:MAG: hypothetical protein EHM43_08900 [Ignavibacteriae bacterium]|nr:MAG: hypothetical protein EHM43_08900 [Ignavibacteriota bacterium]
MKRLALIASVLFVAVVTALAVDATVDYLRARSNGTSVVLEWRSSDEANLAQYEVERAGDDQIFRYVASVNAKGSNQTYSYTDDEAFNKPDGNPNVSATYFTYRLKMVHADQRTSYSTSAGVSHNVSSIKRTWGMIKEMFR